MSLKDSKKLDCRYFAWRLYKRNGVWQADGRSNKVNAGRHSLNTRDEKEARKLVHGLDEKMAAELGLIRFARLDNDVSFKLEIGEGLEIYLEHLNRPRVRKGVKASTKKRYLRVINRFKQFVAVARLQYWEQFNSQFLDSFTKWLERDHNDSSIATAVTVVKTIHRHLIENKHLDDQCRFKYEVTRPKESSKYCPTGPELRAILGVLKANSEFRWLYDLVVVLSFSGLRFGELAQLTHHDVDLKEHLLHVRDESFDPNSSKSTKTGYSRVVPMHPDVEELIRKRLEIDSRYLFEGPRGGKLRSDTFGRNLKEKALIPLAKKFPNPRFQTITAHSFRHFFASLCASQQTSEQVTMDMMGHRTSNMARYYYHRNNKAAVKMIQQFESFTEGLQVDEPSITNLSLEDSDVSTSSKWTG